MPPSACSNRPLRAPFDPVQTFSHDGQKLSEPRGQDSRAPHQFGPAVRRAFREARPEGRAVVERRGLAGAVAPENLPCLLKLIPDRGLGPVEKEQQGEAVSRRGEAEVADEAGREQLTGGGPEVRGRDGAGGKRG